MAHVKIYTSPTCGYCSAAKHLFDSLGVTYEEIRLWDRPDLVIELQAKYQWRTVPMILVNEEFIGGYQDLVALYKQGLLTKKLGLTE